MSSINRESNKSSDHNRSGAALLDILMSTLSESAGILLHVGWAVTYGLDIDHLDSHWETQTKFVRDFMKWPTDEDYSFTEGYQVGANEILAKFLRNELKFQSQLQLAAYARLEECWEDPEIHDYFRELLEYLHVNQAAIYNRLQTIMANIEWLQENGLGGHISSEMLNEVAA